MTVHAEEATDLVDRAEGKTRAPRMSDKAGKSRSKIDRYGWAAPDAQGEFMMIDKNELQVDSSYQRDERSSTVKEVSARLSWAAFGTLSVARRQGAEGSQYFVVDGQHRLLGVMRRSDVEKVPCMVFDVRDQQHEASAFLAANTMRRPVTALEKHRAKTVTGERSAMILKELTDQAGIRLSTAAQPGTLRCVSLIEQLLQKDEKTFRKVWPLIVEVCKGKPIHERIVHGLFYIAKATDGEILKVFWHRKIIELGYDELLRSAASAAAFYSQGGARVWASGMVQLLNRGMKKNRLQMESEVALNAE